MFYVYIFQNNINFKIYVGKTNDPKRRFEDHVQISKVGSTKNKKVFSLIHKAISKYGIENFSFQIIEEFDNEKDVFEAEKFWIEYLRTNVNKFGNEYGYNLTDGGDGQSGRKRTDEEKRKISLGLIGRTFSEEHKRKISKANSQDKKYMFDKYTKIIWPENDILLNMVKSEGFTKTAKKLNVSDNAVRYRLKRRKLI